MSPLVPYLIALKSKTFKQKIDLLPLNLSWQECEKYHYLYEKIEEAELQNSIQRSV